jgi:hypothetical protein
MFILDQPPGISTGCLGPVHFSSLLIEKTQQTSRECPESQDGFRRHDLIMIAPQEILLILKEGFHFPADGENVHQRLGSQIEYRAAPVANDTVSFIHEKR